MSPPPKPSGVIVPLITPITPAHQLDFDALDRLIEFQIASGVQGVLLLGTTGEGPSVPQALRRPLVERAVDTAQKRLRIYVNITELSLEDALASIREFFAVGADAIAALPPFYFPPQPVELTAWFRALLDASPGPVLLYNIPLTTRVSIPLEVVGELIGHPRLCGLKDSENDVQRHAELFRCFGGRADFSIFLGVGALMEHGLKLGADGIVPSVGNLIPGECRRQVEAARRQDWGAVHASAARQATVAALYQQSRTLAQSLAVLKALIHLRGLCSPWGFPPLLPVPAEELEALREQLSKLDLV